jgi:hypothetical protein
MYKVYIQLCQFIHGTHTATGLYSRGLGGFKMRGEFITSASWVLPLRCAWWSFAVEALASFSGAMVIPMPSLASLTWIRRKQL